jgi:hypothetical protein
MSGAGKDPMTGKLLISIAATALLAGCTSSHEPTPPRTEAPSPPAVTSPAAVTPNPRAPSSIELSWLPPEGVVVGRNGGIAFVTLDGRVLTVIHGLTLANPTEAPGPVLMRKGHAWYALDRAGHALRRIGREVADAMRTLDEPAIDLPAPAASMVDGEPAGHWRFALLSPGGDRILAQWSGECEVPTAYVLTLQSGPPAPVTGPGSDGTESFALGWTRGGRAIAVLPYGSCGSGVAVPGVYAFDASGAASLITTVPPTGSARMWGSG